MSEEREIKVGDLVCLNELPGLVGLVLDGPIGFRVLDSDNSTLDLTRFDVLWCNDDFSGPMRVHAHKLKRL